MKNRTQLKVGDRVRFSNLAFHPKWRRIIYRNAKSRTDKGTVVKVNFTDNYTVQWDDNKSPADYHHALHKDWLAKLGR